MNASTEKECTKPKSHAQKRGKTATKLSKVGITVTPYDINAEDIEEQRIWSEATFGPGDGFRPGLIDHIRKELVEIEANPTDLMEWIDLIILALDGAWRVGHSSRDIIAAYHAKMQINRERRWPDWRTAPAGKAIEHIRD